MKNKLISPEDYSQILQALVIENIALMESTFKVNDCDVSGGTINLKFKELHSFQDKENEVYFFTSFTLIGKVKNSENEEDVFTLKGKFNITYTKTQEVEVTEDFFKIFKDLSLPMIVWPYIREYIQNTLVRACIPPVTLPVRRSAVK